MVIAPNEFRDEEFLEPKKIFEDNGFEVIVASKGVDVAKGKLGYEQKIDLDIKDAHASDYDAIVFIGGLGSKVYFEDELALNLARKAKVVAAICIAPTILANAGLLEGKSATCHPSAKEDIEAKGAIYTGKGVEVVGNIVTANGPAAATKFGEAIMLLFE